MAWALSPTDPPLACEARVSPSHMDPGSLGTLARREAALFPSSLCRRAGSLSRLGGGQNRRVPTAGRARRCVQARAQRCTCRFPLASGPGEDVGGPWAGDPSPRLRLCSGHPTHLVLWLQDVGLLEYQHHPRDYTSHLSPGSIIQPQRRRPSLLSEFQPGSER